MIWGPYSSAFLPLLQETCFELHNEPDEFNGSIRIFPPKIAEYTFFSNAQETFSRIDHLLGHKANLNKFKIKVIIFFLFCFFNHRTMKLEINHKKISGETKNTWMLSNMLLHNECVKQEIKKITWKQMKMKT